MADRASPSAALNGENCPPAQFGAEFDKSANQVSARFRNARESIAWFRWACVAVVCGCGTKAGKRSRDNPSLERVSLCVSFKRPRRGNATPPSGGVLGFLGERVRARDYMPTPDA
jgi:hypothetical protein